MRHWPLFILLVVLVGCSRSTEKTSTNTPSSTKIPGSVKVTTTRPPDPAGTARVYLDAWKSEDYAGMYSLLTPLSQDAIKEEDFANKYRAVAAEAALGKGVDYSILSVYKTPQSAQVNYRVTMHSVLVGDIERDTVMNLSLENSLWQVQWDDSLILPELKGGNHLSMEYHVPARANIYDRNGKALVAQSDAVAISLDAGQVNLDQEDSLLDYIYRLTGTSPESLRPTLENYHNNNWGLQLGVVSIDAFKPLEGALSSFSGFIAQPYRSRYYFDGGPAAVAPHVTGYMSAIQKEEVDKFKRLGYKETEKVGRDGLENWGESYLAGKRGGSLYVVSPEGKVLTKLAETNSQPSQAIYTTLDKDLQLGVQRALGDMRGAIVVLEKNTGRVLALASSPGFDPNVFDTNNPNWSMQLTQLLQNPNTPLLDRATMGQYPLGSVFKIITMSAALKSGLYTPQTTYNCGYHFEELFGVTLNDWTWDHYQQDGKTQPSGMLTLPEGLMRSCNPFFWHIGLDLFNQGLTKAVSDMARGFGLGSATGIELNEEAGQIPDPGSQLDATNLAIGQGATLVTPLQVADFVAAVGNGGTLYTPKVVDKIVPPVGDPTYVFTPTIRGHLPITGTMLETVQDAMVSVIADPHGTAHHRFLNFPIPVAGKTGTAQDPPRDPHAWFAGYTFAGRQDKPDVAVAVLVENQGEGSDYAAPIFRRVLEVYFYGKPLSLYWWESQIGVERTPTPIVTETPPLEETATPSP